MSERMLPDGNVTEASCDLTQYRDWTPIAERKRNAATASVLLWDPIPGAGECPETGGITRQLRQQYLNGRRVRVR